MSGGCESAVGANAASFVFTSFSEQVDGGTQIVAAQLRVRSKTATEYHIANEGTLSFTPPIMYHRVSGTGFVDVVFSGASAMFELGSNGANGLMLTYDQDGFIDTIGGVYNGTGADRLSFASTGTGLLDFSSASAGSLGVLFGTPNKLFSLATPPPLKRTVLGGPRTLPSMNHINQRSHLGYTPIVGDVFDLLEWTAVAGLNSGLLSLPSLTACDADWIWDDTKFVSHGVIAITTVILVPSRALLCLIGLALTMLPRRRGK